MVLSALTNEIRISPSKFLGRKHVKGIFLVRPINEKRGIKKLLSDRHRSSTGEPLIIDMPLAADWDRSSCSSHEELRSS